MASPLHWASRSGHIQIVTLLLKFGADLQSKDKQGYNALHLAVHAGFGLMVIYLISFQSDKDLDDELPLSDSITINDQERNWPTSIDIDSRDSLGRTALMWAAYQVFN